MKSLSLYVERDSFIHRVDPITKLFYIFAAIIVPFVMKDLTVSIVCAAVSLILLAVGKVLRNAITVFACLFLIMITIFLIQALANINNATVVFSISGIHFYAEGMINGVKIIMRMTDMVAAFLILILTTKPSDLVEDLIRAGFSPRIGYVIMSIFQIVPHMAGAIDVITDAQRARGVETKGSLPVRIKAFLPLLGPVVLNSFMNTKERAMALEVRAFDAKNKKSFLNEAVNFRHAMAYRVLFVLLAVSAVAWRAGGVLL
ncbi:MAG: energy-coupling factor transporter transmembrane protein EcfT [Clostridiales Family XIII bacterium]|jgi:energy-coupling factor transport system permease protein|nr:energy-coupling factor transporter transmembrane protein EcfT [Clostridiales Family XIII bacterium]